eukprot:scaffold130_cov185-Alexandrium_tamarense.AAC.37
MNQHATPRGHDGLSLGTLFPPHRRSFLTANRLHQSIEISHDQDDSDYVSLGASPTFVLQPKSRTLKRDSGVDASLDENDDSITDNPEVMPSNTVTPPEEPRHSSLSSSDGCNNKDVSPPPPQFAVFTSDSFCNKIAVNSTYSPIKKQKIQDRLELQSSPSDASTSERSCDVPEGMFAFYSPIVKSEDLSSTMVMAGPSFPALLSTPTSTNKRSRPTTDERNAALSTPLNNNNLCSSSPFSPNYRGMMQKLNINSPALKYASPTPEITNTTQCTFTSLPDVPTFSFSPSVDLGKVCMSSNNNGAKFSTIDSSAREGSGFTSVCSGRTSRGSPNRRKTLLGTPDRSAAPSCTSSPYHQTLRGQRTPIGKQSGSSFKMLPPRLHPSGDEFSSNVTGTLSAFQASCNQHEGVVPSPYSSPSIRIVPLTVLSRNGSPVMSSPAPSQSTVGGVLSMPSPLIRSLDQIAKDHKEKDDAEKRSIETQEALNETFGLTFSPNLNMRVSNPKVQASPLSNGSHLALPKIKLTPRKRETNNRASLLLDSTELSPLGSNGDVFMPNLMRLMDPSNAHLAPRGIIRGGGDEDKQAAEMDSLLNGFEQHAGSPRKKPMKQLSLSNDCAKQVSDAEQLNQSDGEEEEMVELSHGPLLMPWLSQESMSCSFNWNCSDGDISQSSLLDTPNLVKHGGFCNAPLPSITLPGNQQSHEDENRPKKQSFLPRPLPRAQKKSRSLFNPSNYMDPIQKILEADAIAEAARSNEPLTDDDSDTESNAFLLCLPRVSNCGRSRGSATLETKSRHSFTSGVSRERVESPAFHESSKGSLGFHGLSSPIACAIPEDSLSPMELEDNHHPASSFTPASSGCFKNRGNSDATFSTFCSLSDCDSSDNIASPRHALRPPSSGCLKSTGLDIEAPQFRPRDRSSVCSFLSMTSLCGLDIVHESSNGDEMNDRVPVLMSSESSELFKHRAESPAASMFFRPMRSELSLNSLGLSVDSGGDACNDQRDLFTPPVTTSRGSRYMLSPPPLRPHAATSLIDSKKSH